MRMDAQPIKKLLSACPALLGHDFKPSRLPKGIVCIVGGFHDRRLQGSGKSECTRLSRPSVVAQTSISTLISCSLELN